MVIWGGEGGQYLSKGVGKRRKKETPYFAKHAAALVRTLIQGGGKMGNIWGGGRGEVKSLEIPNMDSGINSTFRKKKQIGVIANWWWRAFNSGRNAFPKTRQGVYEKKERLLVHGGGKRSKKSPAVAGTPMRKNHCQS